MENSKQSNHNIDNDVAHVVDLIDQAQVYDVAIESALSHAFLLSNRLDNHIYLKREDQQSVFSFKLRGAYNKIRNLSAQQLEAGIIAASAGNHAQGVALSAKRMNIDALIVMPVTTPGIKVDSVRNLGAQVLLSGDNYDDACARAYDIAASSGRTFIHPYDDYEIMAGQGTIAKELLKQSEHAIDAVFIPVGGGGLVAGMSAWIKTFSPTTKVIGVEPIDAPTLQVALEHNERRVLSQVGIFADGVAVKQIGKLTFDIARKCVDEVILVSVDEICAAVKDVFDDTRVVSEPAGALAVAGIKKYVQQNDCHNLNLVAINSGANINFDRLRHVTERTELSEGREGLFAVTIPEQPGSFLKFCELIGNHSISEFNYRYSDSSDAHIFVGIKFDDAGEDKAKLVDRLMAKDYVVNDLSDNEMAKLHLRHMVGGHAPHIDNELLYRFEFPERPGALLQFLSLIGSMWNISLFHYRNHGAAYGRVLIGIQVPEYERDKFKAFMHQLGFVYNDETNNPINDLFFK